MNTPSSYQKYKKMYETNELLAVEFHYNEFSERKRQVEMDVARSLLQRAKKWIEEINPDRFTSWEDALYIIITELRSKNSKPDLDVWFKATYWFVKVAFEEDLKIQAQLN